MENQYGAKVENGRIIVNDNNGTESITIKTCNGIDLYINGSKVSYGLKYPVTSNDEITYVAQVVKPERKMDLQISDDRMEARLKITYAKGYTFKLVDKPYFKNLTLRSKKIELDECNQYTIDEIKKLLNNTKIKFGINISKIFQAVLGTDENGLVVAKGTKCVDDVPKRLELCIKTEETQINYDDSSIINYRNRVNLPNVEAGDVIAKIIERVEGNNGEDIYGEILKKKTIKDPKILVGEGCEIKENVVVALYSGRPVFKSNILSINKTLRLRNVNLKSGNVNFAGDVIIDGKVDSGSNINCGGILEVNGTIEDSKIISNGNSTYNSAILNSVILTGAYDIEKTSYMDILKEFLKYLEELINLSEQFSEKIEKKPIGEIIEFLIEQRYMNINKLGMQILTKNIQNGITDSSILDFIRTKLLNMGALNIRHIHELILFKELIRNTIDDLSTDSVINLDCNLSYAQKSVIKTTGNILFKGMGSYQSRVYALENVVYQNEDSICRGGCVEAANGNIKLGTVGSRGGVNTQINCKNLKGIIEAKIAYVGTIFTIGNQKYRVKDNIRNVKVYLDVDGKITCESLKY